MLQSLISLEDTDIDLVLDAVSSWCLGRNIAVDSVEGRHATTIAIEIVCNRRTDDLTTALTEHLDKTAHSFGK